MIGDASLDSIFSKEQGLYTLGFNEGTVIFKIMTLEQIKTVERILQNFPSLQEGVEDQIWENCVVKHSFLEEPDSLPAGIVSTLAETVLRLSSPSSISEIHEDLSSGRSFLNDAREQVILFICKAFPAYKPEEVECQEWTAIMKRLAQAEIILQTEFELKKAEQSVENQKTIDGVNYYDFNQMSKDLKEVE